MLNRILNKIKHMPEGIKSGIVYMTSTLITRGLVIITVPIFTRIMKSDQIGVVNLYNSWFSMISVIATLSLTSGGYQLALKEFIDDKDAYESSVLSITSLMAVIIAIIYFMGRNFWDKYIGLPQSLMVLMLIGFFVNPAQDFWMSRQRFDYRYKLAGIISVCTAIAALSLSVWVVLKIGTYEDDTAEARLWSNYIIFYSVAACFWFYIMLKGRTFFNKKYWKFSLAISIPLIGHAIAKQILDVSDRIMINFMIGKSAVGIYSTLYAVSSTSLIAWNAINASYIPYLFKNIDDRESKKDIQNSALLLFVLYSLITISITYLAPEIVKILATQEYYEAVSIMPPIAIGVSLTAVSNMYSNVLIYYKKTKVIMIASFSAALTNLILNAIFIPHYGFQAAAFTTLVAYIVLVVVEVIVATKTYKKVSGENEMIYSNVSIFCMCFITGILSMFALVLYAYTILRYILWIVMVCTIGIVFYKYKVCKR